MTVCNPEENFIEQSESTEEEYHDVCFHPRIIEDYIDIDPEKSIQIFYCDTCYITVNQNETAVSDTYTDEPPMTLGAPVEFMPLVDN
jgi:hypothetical protein